MMRRARKKILIAWPIQDPSQPAMVSASFMHCRADVEALLSRASGTGKAALVARVAERFTAGSRDDGAGRICRSVIRVSVRQQTTARQLALTIAGQMDKARRGPAADEGTTVGGTGRKTVASIFAGIQKRLLDRGHCLLILDDVHHLSPQQWVETRHMLRELVRSGLVAVICTGIDLDQTLMTEPAAPSPITAHTGARVVLYQA